LNLIKNVDWHLNKQRAYLKPKVQNAPYWYPQLNYLDRIKIGLKLLFDSHHIVKPRLVLLNKMESFEGNLLIHPFSSDSRRELDNIQIIRICEKFKSKRILIHGTRSELLKLNTDALPHNVRTLEAKEALLPLIKMIFRNYFITVDSFPIHLADAYNTKFIGLFSHTEPKSVLVNSQTSIKFDEFNLCKIPPEVLVEEIMMIINSEKWDLS
jgi:ADP-heptose:LPS heptosyltransferase